MPGMQRINMQDPIVIYLEQTDHRHALEYAWRSLLGPSRDIRLVSYGGHAAPAAAPISFSYGRDLPPFRAKRHIHVRAAQRFWSSYLQPDSLPQGQPAYLDAALIRPREAERSGRIPIVYGPKEGNVWARLLRDETGSTLETNADVVASAFFLLTRYEEILNCSANTEGFACRQTDWLTGHGLADKPLVDEYRRLIEVWMEVLGYEANPPDERFGILPTHDIDWLIKHRTWGLSAKAVGLRALVYRRPAQALREAAEALWIRFGQHDDPYYRAVEWLMDLSGRYGWTSHFFFMTGGESRHDAFYPIGHPLVREACQRIVTAGHRIGLHPSYESYTDPQVILAEKQVLEQVTSQTVSGGRQHFLRFKVPDTWRHYAQAGLTYDSSFGYSGRNGFRCGTCRPFVAFDAVREELIPVVEYPLIVMDVCITRRADWSAERMAEEIIRYGRITREFSGVLTILWHNSESWPTARKAYEQAVEEIARLDPMPIDAACESEARLAAWGRSLQRSRKDLQDGLTIGPDDG